MKNIVICFDGTWNTSDAPNSTNVVKTAQILSSADAQGITQVVFYDAGVGSGNVTVANRINQLLGGAFGAGLMENIARAYRFLIFNYSPGDRIFVFGFSRGAFSARSFGGLLRTCGILRKDRIREVNNALEVYRTRNPNDADDQPSVDFRNEHSVACYWGDKIRPLRDERLTIEYLGVWDTVGALGVPGFNYFNRRYGFHNADLSSMVKAARHVVSVDERRLTFAPTLWTNLAKLNGGPQTDASAYQQAWFPGDHASVGGGGAVHGLWQASLVWVLEGAERAGLGLEARDMERLRNEIVFTKRVRSSEGFDLSQISVRRWRVGPDGKLLADVSGIAQQRLKAAANVLDEGQLYRPLTLKTFVTAFANDLGVTWPTPQRRSWLGWLRVGGIWDPGSLRPKV